MLRLETRQAGELHDAKWNRSLVDRRRRRLELAAGAGDPPIALVPKPLRVEWAAGKFVLTPRTVILVDKDSADAANVARQLAERICRATGFKLAVTPYDGTQLDAKCDPADDEERARRARPGRVFARRDGRRRDDCRR